MTSFCPFVANFVRIVVEKAKIGICAGNISIIDISAGSVSVGLAVDEEEEEDGEQDTSAVADRFRVALPYAGQYVTWELIFNSCYPKDAPEIILGPDAEEEFQPDIERLENYCNWDSSDEDCLLLTLRDLLSEYRAFHLSLLSGSRLEFDYNSLLDDESSSGCRSDDIEVYVSRKNGFSSGPVRFLIRLNVNFAVIPDYLMKDAGVGGNDMALLLVTYQNLDGGTVSPQILFSPRIERVLAVYGGVRILPFPHEGCLMDYVPAVRQHLEKTVQAIVSCFERRKEYMASFVALFGSRVVEFDSVGYSDVVCLFEWQNFRFLLSVELSSRFPQEQPTFTFQSVYHTKADGSPYCKTFNRYPYSPRWSSLEMTERARTFIIGTIPSFQKDSIQEGLN